MRILRAAVLALLSAITAEFLLGDQWLGAAAPPTQQVAQLVLYVAFYGCAAVLIRDIARRTRRGWPTILLLALAFGLVHEGIVDQSLFNAHFAGAHLLDNGLIPWLGISGPWTVFVLTLHVVWSIGAPIAVAEGLWPRSAGATRERVQLPWLRVPGTIVAGILLLLSGFVLHLLTVEQSSVNDWQFVAIIVIAAAAVAVSVMLPRRPAAARPPSHPLPAVLVGAVATTVFLGVYFLSRGPARDISPWLIVGVDLVAIAAGAFLVARFRLDVPGLALGALVSYSWFGLVRALPLGPGPTLEQVAIVVAVLTTAAIAVIRERASLDARPGTAHHSDTAALDAPVQRR